MGRKPELEPSSNDVSPGGVFRSLGGFLDLLSNLAEQGGGELERSGELGNEKQGVKAVYGCSVRVGAATSSYRNGVFELRLTKAK